jgi:hypothetical protein
MWLTDNPVLIFGYLLKDRNKFSDYISTGLSHFGETAQEIEVRSDDLAWINHRAEHLR